MVGIIVNEMISVSPQIKTSDLQEIKDQGFETIICNRPNGEAIDQTPFEEIEILANKLGIKTIYQPIIGGSLNLEAAIEFANHLEHSGKTFAYCRSGTRSICLWAIAAREKGISPNEISEHCALLGYDVSGVLANI